MLLLCLVVKILNLATFKNMTKFYFFLWSRVERCVFHLKSEAKYTEQNSEALVAPPSTVGVERRVLGVCQCSTLHAGHALSFTHKRTGHLRHHHNHFSHFKQVSCLQLLHFKFFFALIHNFTAEGKRCAAWPQPAPVN